MPTIAETFNNPKFQALSPADKIAVLQRIDPNFAKLSPQDQQAVVAKAAPMGFSAPAPQFAGQEPAGPQPGSQVPDVTTAGGVASEFVGGAGETFNPWNIVRGLAQAAQAQAPTDKWTTVGGALSNIGKMIEGPAGMIINPLAKATGTAAKWYWDAARGKIPYAYEQALTAAPEALGQGAAQAALMRGPIESVARTEPVNALARLARLSPAPEVPIRPGPLFGVATRAKAAMNAIEQQHASVPVSPVSAYAKAIDAYNASLRGFTMPKPISDFLDTMNAQNGRITFEQARLFEKSLGETVSWEGKTDFMNGLMKQMREALVRDNTAALERASPGTGRAYQTAKVQFERASIAKAQGGKVAGGAGAIAGYELGGKVGNPLAVGAVLAPIARHFLRGAAESGIEGVTNLPKPFANIPGTTRLGPLTAGFTAPVHQPPPDEEGQ